MKTAHVLTLMLLSACTRDRTLDEITETTVSPLGGVARSFDSRAELHFSAGAVSEPVVVTIRTRRTRQAGLASPIYETGPTSLHLATPATVRILGDHPSLVLAELARGAPVRLSGARRDPSSGWVEASVTELGSYALTADPGVDAGVDAGQPEDAGSDLEDAGPEDAGLADAGIELSDAGEPPDTGETLDSGLGDAGEIADIGVNNAEVDDDGGSPTPLPICNLSPIPETEPNDTVAQANVGGALGSRQPWYGTLPPSDIDWYRFTLGAPATVRLTTHTTLGDPGACSTTDTEMALFDAAGVELGSNDDANGTCSALAHSLGAGTFDVRIGGTGTYYLSITAGSASGPDLTVFSMQAFPSIWHQGQTSHVSLCIENVGDAPALTFETSLHVSSDPILDPSDVALWLSATSPLAAGAIRQEDFPVMLPHSIPPSMIHIVGLLDSSNQVLEADETNNLGATGVQIIP